MQSKARLGVCAIPAGVCMSVYAFLRFLRIAMFGVAMFDVQGLLFIAASLPLCLLAVAAAVFLFRRQRSLVPAILFFAAAGYELLWFVYGLCAGLDPVLYGIAALLWGGLGLICLRRRHGPARGPWWLLIFVLPAYLLASVVISFGPLFSFSDGASFGMFSTLFVLMLTVTASDGILCAAVLLTALAYVTAPKNALV